MRSSENKKGCCSCCSCPKIRCPTIRCPRCCVKILPCFRHPVLSCRFAFAIFSLTLGAIFASYTTILIRKRKAQQALGFGGTPTTPPPITTTAIPSPEPSDEETNPSMDTPRMRAVADQLVEATSKDVLMTVGSPQNLAFMWLVNDDERQVHSSHPNLVQRYALATLYFATGGSSWSTAQANRGQQKNDETVIASPRTVLTNNWLTSLHECEWMFVSCKDELVASEKHDRRLRLRSNKDRMLNEHDHGLLAEGTVVGLDLDHKKLIGNLPPEIGVLESIETLDLASNSLHGGIPVTVGSMKELQILRLDNNYFSGSIPEELGRLTELEELRLENNNELTGAVPMEVCTLMDYSSVVMEPIFTVPHHLACSCCDESGAVVARKKNEVMSEDGQEEVEELEKEVKELEEEVEQLQQEVKNMPVQVTTATPTESSTMKATTATPTKSSTVTTATPTEAATVQPNDKDETPPPFPASSAAALIEGTNDGVRRN